MDEPLFQDLDSDLLFRIMIHLFTIHRMRRAELKLTDFVDAIKNITPAALR